MNFTIPSDNIISGVDEVTPSNLKLYKRPDNAITAFPAPFASGTFANNSTKVIQFTGFTTQTSFSQFEIGSSTSPLPITLLEFKGLRVQGLNGESTEDVKLNWKTATEINNKGFEVETSENTKDFQKIAFVDGNANQLGIRNYELGIKQPNSAYYRLKQVDFDGNFVYSNVIFVEGFTQQIKVYPNPASEYVILENILKNGNTHVNISVFDPKGINTINFVAKQNTIKIMIKNFQKGIYLFKIGNEIKKIVIE